MSIMDGAVGFRPVSSSSAGAGEARRAQYQINTTSRDFVQAFTSDYRVDTRTFRYHSHLTMLPAGVSETAGMEQM